jgi:hypothetical protein
MSGNGPRYRFGKPVTVNRQGAAGRHLVCVGSAHDERAKPAHFLVQQTDCVVLRVVGTKRIRADKLGAAVGLMNRRTSFRPHFMQHDRNACLRKLPGCLRARETAADNVNRIYLTRCHSMMHRLMTSKPQWR